MERIEKIRQRIKLTRITKGYSQDYIGKLLHMSQFAYQKLESGKTKLKVKTLIDLALILEVRESYFTRL
jgi:transcriptional regulator with XRE-family HTH domain